jgi:hypothetical protein
MLHTAGKAPFLSISILATGTAHLRMHICTGFSGFCGKPRAAAVPTLQGAAYLTVLYTHTVRSTHDMAQHGTTRHWATQLI